MIRSPGIVSELNQLFFNLARMHYAITLRPRHTIPSHVVKPQTTSFLLVLVRNLADDRPGQGTQRRRAPVLCVYDAIGFVARWGPRCFDGSIRRGTYNISTSTPGARRGSPVPPWNPSLRRFPVRLCQTSIRFSTEYTPAFLNASSLIDASCASIALSS